jgi:hypothetical protein
MNRQRADSRTAEIALPGSGSAEVALQIGRVVKVAAGSQISLDIDGSPVVARRAASCLLEPAVGDDVLIGRSRAESYVLAILVRTGPASASLSVNVPNEEVVLRGGDVVLSAERELRLEAAALAVRTRRFALVAEVMSFVGQTLTQFLERWRSSARSVEIVATDIAMKAARRTSLVEETDVLQAGTLVQTIATAAVTSAQSAVVAAEQDLRLDGERVTVG